MASLYIHIPFCRQACYYCDFHFSTRLDHKATLIEALCKELKLQKDYLTQKQLRSIYLGGGTPSLLSEYELSQLFETISQYYHFDEQTEVTLEANPDDLTDQQLETIQKLPINRLSIGIQSFHDGHLNYLNRVHTSSEAIICVERARDIGISNISIDLIYGIPSVDHSIWEKDLQKAFTLPITHLSAYCLTIEPDTVFGRWQMQGKIRAVEDDFANEQWTLLLEAADRSGFIQYEISNFCQPNAYAVHNSNYWAKGEYLGIGPSAHSYNLRSRQFNVAHNHKYLKAINMGEIPAEVEQLNAKDHTNEYLLTSLRTIWGSDLQKLQYLSGTDFLQVQRKYIEKYTKAGLLSVEPTTLKLTQKGKLLADTVIADLFLV
ncbi:MAG: radical SAM family heme chaperone HemW [Thermonemataceae bacterium]